MRGCTLDLAAVARSPASVGLCVVLLSPGCSDDAPTSPTPVPPRATAITVVQMSPPSGATIVVPVGPPPGAFIPRGSGLLSVALSISTGSEAAWAQLNVYLMSGADYCGQNLPDSPTWAPLGTDQTVVYAVTGFQVYRLPCTVTGIRAVLHTRNSGALTPPAATETIADITVPVTYQLRQ